jgi:hypothetical protein
MGIVSYLALNLSLRFLDCIQFLLSRASQHALLRILDVVSISAAHSFSPTPLKKCRRSSKATPAKGVGSERGRHCATRHSSRNLSSVSCFDIARGLAAYCGALLVRCQIAVKSGEKLRPAGQ